MKCVTHHHACDCREERFKKVEAALFTAGYIVEHSPGGFPLITPCNRGPNGVTVPGPELRRLQQERDAYREALDFYACKFNWHIPQLLSTCDDFKDVGDVARAVLVKWKRD